MENSYERLAMKSYKFDGGKIYHGDVMNVLPKIKENHFHACITDPPYHLHTSSNSKKGFHNREWDGGEIAFNIEMWKFVYRSLLPGAYLLAFSAPKNYHKLVTAVESAGFEIRDMLMYLFGNGMQKGANIGKKDKKWKGYNSNLAPGYEPILVAQKPFIGTIVDTCIKNGCGAFNIDDCRIPVIGTNSGRVPKNLIHSGDQEIVDMFPTSTTTGKRTKTSQEKDVKGTAWLNSNHKSKEYTDSGSTSRYYLSCPLDTDYIERIKYTAKASKKERFLFCKNCNISFSPLVKHVCTRACSSTNLLQHPSVKPFSLVSWLSKLVKPPITNAKLLVPFSGSGSEILGAISSGWDHVIGVEQSLEYLQISLARIEA